MSDKLPRLYYPSANGPRLLPEWAYFFMRLGYQLATMQSDEHRFVVGLAIPARAFASSLVTTGGVLARAGTKDPSNDMQLQYVLELEPGTPIYIRNSNNRKVKGILEGFAEFFGKTHIVMKTASSQKNFYALDIYASRVTIAEKDISLPEKQQKGYVLELPSEFLQCCVGKDVAKEHFLNSSFEALIVGKVSVVQHEACEQQFICSTIRKIAGPVGCLQDIMRIRQFSRANSSYRSQCIASSKEDTEKGIKGRKPRIVIFDGAVAYIRHSQKWKTSHHIALLDKTERQFMEAIALINQNYTYRSDDDFKFQIKIPNSIEMMIYKEQSQ